MDAFLKEYYQKNKCPRKHVLHQTAIAAPRAPKSASIGVVPAMILPHLQQADAPALEPHMLVGRGVSGAAPPGPPRAVHSDQGKRNAAPPARDAGPSTAGPTPMDGVDSTTRGVRRERQGTTNIRRDEVGRKKLRIPETNLQTKRGKNFDDYGTKMFRGQYGRSRSSTGAPGRSARLAGLP